MKSVSDFPACFVKVFWLVSLCLEVILASEVILLSYAASVVICFKLEGFKHLPVLESAVVILSVEPKSRQSFIHAFAEGDA